MKLTEMKNAGLANDEIRKQLEETTNNLTSNKQKFNRSIMMLQVKEKEEKKWKILFLKERHESNKRLKQFTQNRPEKPALKDSYPDLHKIIVAIVTAGAEADSRQRTENLNACLTLDDLRNCLMKDGYELSRSALHLRLLPRRENTIEGKKHIKNVPIKIKRAKNNLRKKHADVSFTFATKEYLKNISTVFGPDSVLVLSTDNRVKVPNGITAATKQAPMVMHVTYEVRLPEHEFVVATSHKLTPSVYAACEITKIF